MSKIRKLGLLADWQLKAIVCGGSIADETGKVTDQGWTGEITDSEPG